MVTIPHVPYLMYLNIFKTYISLLQTLQRWAWYLKGCQIKGARWNYGILPDTLSASVVWIHVIPDFGIVQAPCPHWDQISSTILMQDPLICLLWGRPPSPLGADILYDWPSILPFPPFSPVNETCNPYFTKPFDSGSVPKPHHGALYSLIKS